MQQYVTELSKYAISILMVLFTFCSLAGMFQRVQKLKAVYLFRLILVFSMQFIMFFNLALVSRNLEYIFLYIFVQVLLLILAMLVPVIYEDVNRQLLGNLCMFLGIGICVLSALNLNKAIRQYIMILIALVFSLFIPWLLWKLKFLSRLTWVYGGTGILILSLVMLLSEETYGAKISFSLGNITFQPSEFVKIIYIFFLSAALSRKQTRKRLVLTGFLAGCHVLVLVCCKDLGSALIYFVGFIFMIVAATGKYRYFLVGTLGGSVAACLAYVLFGHVQTRIHSWLNPWEYIDTKGYAITQSLFAISSGDWFGTGLLQGNPSAIPFVEADFIFSAICEELGVIFGVCLLVLILFWFVEIMKLAGNLTDRFYRLVAYGIGIFYIFQIFLTVGGGINLIPLTGVTLPFISYGGSSLLSSMLMFFILQGIHIENIKSGVALNFTKTTFKKSAFFIILFAIIILKLLHFTITDKETMLNNSYNSRQEILLSQNKRGTIYSRDGEILAETLVNETKEETRVYPFGNLFSHVIGYSTMGKTGVEESANYYLINTNISLANKAANQKSGEKNPGDNVYTTLDVQLQTLADEQLGDYQGAIIVSEVQTGKILAMVSHPDFDPNNIQDMWETLIGDSTNSVLVNRATQGLYPPGSTFKILTALEYARENPSTFHEYTFNCSGHYSEEGHQINCYHGFAHGAVDFTDSLALSCNSAFANMGIGLDQKSFQRTLEDLFFNNSLPLDFEYKESSVTITREMSSAEMMQTVIGQGKTQMTPLHLHMITSAIANNGCLQIPYLIDHVENAQGDLVKQFASSSYGQLITEEEAGLLKDLMHAAVEEGTAYHLREAEYSVAGKTGSAEYNSARESHAWFTGFAPVEAPEVCVTVIVESAGSGSDYAVPIAGEIFEHYFTEKK